LLIKTSDAIGAGMCSAQIKSLNNEINLGGTNSQLKLLNNNNISMTNGGGHENEVTGIIEIDSASSSKNIPCPINITSLSHVLLPLALHPLTSIEFQKKDHLTLLQEGAAFVGAIGLHLPWNQYFALIKTILKQLDREKVEKEKILLTALCSLLDSFHFELTGDEEVCIYHTCIYI
jgi:hypothetical protein